MEDSKPFFAFFSAKAAKAHGFVTYLNAKGEEVDATCIKGENNTEGYLWDDVQCLGEVMKCVRIIDQNAGAFPKLNGKVLPDPAPKIEDTNFKYEKLNYKKF